MLEPKLIPVRGEELPQGSNCSDGARADVSALGFWLPMNRAFFDIRVVNPLALSNSGKDLNDMYADHESRKKKEYNARILQIEKGTFSPIIFSCFGGAGPEANAMIKRLAAKLSLKRNETYSDTVGYLRKRFSFAIIKTCVLSFRGERPSGKAGEDEPVDMDEVEFAFA